MIAGTNHINFDTKAVPSPCFVVDQQSLEQNLSVLQYVQEKTGAKILLALKGFAMFSTFSTLNKVLDGTCASSVDEARLGREEFGGEVHTFSPAYSDETLDEILTYSDHVVFNTINQWQRFKTITNNLKRNIKFGLRINPEYSENKTPLYDPCRPGSRLGILSTDFEGCDLENISGLHFHTLCEQDSFALERTLRVVEEEFGQYLSSMDWVNFGGGHHITRARYNIDHLCLVISEFQEKYGVQVYLEPGEAVVLNAGVFVTTILDTVKNGKNIAILDSSVSTHLPDVLEMPYRPFLIGAGDPFEKKHTFTLGGISCLAGDIIGEYSFDEPLLPGDKLVFTDMAHYTMVKTNTFNGVRLPSIAINNQGTVNIVREFGYEDFKSRLS